MGAPKGNKFSYGGGRPKGVPNRSTIEFKQAVTNLLKAATPKMVKWLEDVAAVDQAKALELVYKFAQFGYPLLARTDVQTLDKDGKPADNQFTVKIIAGNPDNK